MASPPKLAPKTTFGQPEKTNWPRIVMLVLLIAAGLGLIFYLAKIAKPEHRLACSEHAPSGNSLMQFGRCSEE
jgi:hypothetical protein